MPHQGTLDLEMDVPGLPVRISARRDEMTVTDVHPSREGLLPIDSQYLPVIPKIDVERGREQGRGDVTRDGKTTPSQMTAGNRAPIQFPDPVDQNPDDDTPSMGFGQGVDKTLARFIHIENVSRQINGVPGPFNRRQHGRIGLITIVE